MDDKHQPSTAVPGASSSSVNSGTALVRLPTVQQHSIYNSSSGSTAAHNSSGGYFFDRSDAHALDYLREAATADGRAVRSSRRRRGNPGDGVLLGAYKEKYQGHTIELRYRSHRLIGLRAAREQKKQQEAIEAGRARVAAILAGRQTLAQQRLNSTVSYSGVSRYKLQHHDVTSRRTAQPGDLCDQLRTGMLLTRSSSEREVGDPTRTRDTKTTLEWRCKLRDADREVKELDEQATRLQPSHTPSPCPSLASDTLTRLRAVHAMEEKGPERRAAAAEAEPDDAQAQTHPSVLLSREASVDRYFNHRLYLRLPVRC